MKQETPTISKLLSLISNPFLEELKSSSETQQIELLASLFFTIDEIAIILNITDADEFRREVLYDKESPKYFAYKRGTFLTQVSLRMDTLEFAKAGSNKATEQMQDFLFNQKMNEGE